VQLYLLYGCPFGHRASIVLQEKQLDFQPVFFDPKNRPPELDAVGPHAKSPTLFDGDVRVFDSQIVIEYLEDRYPERPLMPKDAAQRAQVRMMAALVPMELGPSVGPVVAEIVYKPQRDEAKVAAGTRAFLDAMEPWDRRLEGRTYLVGNQLSLADVTLYTLFPSMNRLVGVEIPAERKHLRAWYDRMTARPTTKLLERR
jgi:glutathione S-transferase